MDTYAYISCWGIENVAIEVVDGKLGISTNDVSMKIVVGASNYLILGKKGFYHVQTLS